MFINDIKDYKYKESIEITDNIILDIDENNEIGALEIIRCFQNIWIEKKIQHPIMEYNNKNFSRFTNQ